MSGDMRFVGLFQIIYGALMCLGIVYAVVGIPMIIAGLRLREAGDAYDALSQGDAAALQRAYTGQASFFRILKIMTIIGLVILGIGIIAVIGIIIIGGVGSLVNR